LPAIFPPSHNLGIIGYGKCHCLHQSKKKINDSFIEVNAELKDLGQGIYFSITGKIVDGKCECSGCIHEDIIQAFPEFEKFIKWHLCSVKNGPMHYLANSLYHAGWTDFTDKMNFDHFKSTSVWGVLDNDNKIDIASLMNNDQFPYEHGSHKANREKLKKVLEARKPRLMKKMHSELSELFGDDYPV
jgi:hypothetical protein